MNILYRQEKKDVADLLWQTHFIAKAIRFSNFITKSNAFLLPLVFCQISFLFTIWNILLYFLKIYSNKNHNGLTYFIAKTMHFFISIVKSMCFVCLNWRNKSYFKTYWKEFHLPLILYYLVFGQFCLDFRFLGFYHIYDLKNFSKEFQRP